MDTTPLEITQREFSRRFRGIDPDEVQHYLEQLAEEMTRLLHQVGEQAAQIQRLEAQIKGYQDREDTLRNTLLAAQQMSDEMKATAKREGELLLKEAELRAERLMDQAHQKLGQVQAEVAELKRQRDLFAAKLRGLLKTHTDLLDAATLDTPAPQK